MSCCCASPSSTHVAENPCLDVRNGVKNEVGRMEWLRLALSFIGAAQVMMVSIAVSISELSMAEAFWLHHGLAWGSLVLMAFLWIPLWRSVWSDMRRGKVTIEVFFFIGIVGSYVASVMGSLYATGGVYYEVPFVLFFIYYFGKVLGRWRESQARKLMQGWVNVLGKARVVRGDGVMEMVSVADLKKGDIVYVGSKEWIPVDGRLVRGEALVDEMALSGEPEPVRRCAGVGVMAGTIPIDVGIEIEMLASTAERPRAVDYILDRLSAVDMRESSYQKMADRFVKYFLPIVLGVAGATLVFWWMREGDWGLGLYRALTVIVVACPCALGLATPIGLWSGFRAMTRRGIILRSADFIERLSKVDEVIFDKTGTLSEEKMRRVKFARVAGDFNGSVELMVGALQRHASHPIARAFEDWMLLPGVENYVCDAVQVLAGKGVNAVIREKNNGKVHVVEIGNSGILNRSDWDKLNDLEGIGRGSGDGAVMVYVKIDNEVVGVAFLNEVYRSTMAKALQELEKMRLKYHVMSGDSEERVRALGLEQARWGMTPEDKIQAVRRLRSDGKNVLFVGDGMNDSGAMQEANVSIAVSSAIPLTREVAGAELAEARLDLIPEAIRVSRSMCRDLRRNLFFAAGYNVVGMSLAATGVIDPVVAAVLMLSASVTVTWRALRWGEKIQARGEGV